MRSICLTIVLSLMACNDQPPVIEEGGGAIATPTPRPDDDDDRQRTQETPWQNEGLSETQETPINHSNGSGGSPGYQELNFRNSSYKINVPNDISPQRPYGLHIHLHGDGGGGYRDFPNRETRQELIGVAVRAPNPNLQWGRNEGVPHANFLRDLIESEIFAKYPIRTDRVYFSGVSGGAYFLTGHFIPLFGQNYNSGALILCGGMAPFQSPANTSFLQTFRMHYVITSGERGDITQSVNQSLDAYRGLYGQAGASAKLTNLTMGSAGHCVFDNISYTTGIQRAINEQFSAILQ